MSTTIFYIWIPAELQAQPKPAMSFADKIVIASILIPGLDRADFTGLSEALSRLPNSDSHEFAMHKGPRPIGGRHAAFRCTHVP